MRESLSKGKKTSLSEKAYLSLKESIVQGELKEGDLITESNVGEYLGMSRTPVRQALTKLEHENYVKCIDGIGTIVLGLSLKDLRDIYDVRISLETLALKTSIDNISIESIEKMREDFQKGLKKYNEKEEMTATEVSKIDSDFHKLIVSNSKNNYIINLMNVIDKQVDRYQIKAYSMTDTFKESVKQHLEILKAIESRDYEVTRKLLEDHIEWSYSELYKVL